MLTIMLHVPVNTRGYLTRYLKTKLKHLEPKITEQISIVSPHDEAYAGAAKDSWLEQALKDNLIPDIIVANGPGFASFYQNQTLYQLFDNIALDLARTVPVREDMQPLIDQAGKLFPISVYPLALIYNKALVKQGTLLNSWQDLFNQQFKVVFPDRDKPLTRAVGAYLLDKYPEQFKQFESRVTYAGGPKDIIRKVASAKYHMAMTLGPFAMMAPKQKIAIHYAKEGFVAMPQLLAVKKGNKEALQIAAMFLEEALQLYLQSQAIWSVRKLNEAKAYQHSQMLSEFEEWKSYFKKISDFDHYKLC